MADQNGQIFACSFARFARHRIGENLPCSYIATRKQGFYKAYFSPALVDAFNLKDHNLTIERGSDSIES